MGADGVSKPIRLQNDYITGALPVAPSIFMSLYAADLINSIYNIEELSYLELGIWYGNTFNKIKCKDKVSVDTQFPATFNCTTDEFFQHNNRRFDIVFIDADHSYPSVCRDFNNSVFTVKKYIVVHDLVPPDKNHTKPDACGDSYKLLHYIVQNVDYANYFTLNRPEDCGLTIFRRPFPLIPIDSNLKIEYDDFVVNTLPKVKFADFNTIIERLNHER